MTDRVRTVGLGWPDPTEPGVPAMALDDGFHWMSWPTTGRLTVGQWSADLWCWVISYYGELTDPDQMDHLNYIGPVNPP